MFGLREYVKTRVILAPGASEVGSEAAALAPLPQGSRTSTGYGGLPHQITAGHFFIRRHHKTRELHEKISLGVTKIH